MKIKYLAILFSFIYINLYSQLTFQENAITSQTFLLNDVSSVYSSDIDGDGDMDLLSASSIDDKITWFENTDGMGSFGVPKTITTQANGAHSVFASDIDGDGDIDVLSASLNDNDIAWYENLDGQGNFSAQKIISTDGNNARSVFSSDLDGDGDMDVLSAFNQKIVWYENLDGQGNFSDQKIITTSVFGGYSVEANDIDGDGDMDIISASAFDNKVAWYENTDGQGSFSAQKIISNNVGFVYSVSSNDLDNDGDIDIVYTSFSTNTIAWFENLDGQGNFSSEKIITNSASQVSSTYTADMDDDGDIDILSTYNDKITWYENTDSQGNFGSEKIISSSNSNNSANSIYAIDIDGDNDLDVVSNTYQNIIWFENTDGLGNFSEENLVISSTDEARTVFTADIDNDGDLDILSASSEDDKISWFENIDGLGTYGVQKRIASTNGAINVLAADIDNDGDMDIVATGHNSNKTFWQENLDGLGNFGVPKNIVTGTNFNTSIYMSDIDGDGDLDLLSDASWYENTDGLGTFSSEKIIDNSISQLYYTYASDIDGDGDMDVLTASAFSNNIAWYENTDGTGTFGMQQVINTIPLPDANYVITADLDGDGDMDVLSASFGDHKIAWYENTDGMGNFGAQQVITVETNGAITLFTSDLDNDGDIDVLSASPSDNKIAWYENTDGMGNFGSQQIISSNALGAVDVFASDINNDGKMDVLSASFSDDKIAWYKNITSQLSVNNSDLSKTYIYPNPTSDNLIVKTNETINKIKIFNILGKEITNFSFENYKINVSYLSSGIYILKLSINNKVKILKFSKE